MGTQIDTFPNAYLRLVKSQWNLIILTQQCYFRFVRLGLASCKHSISELIGVRGTNMGIVKTSQANVYTFASALKNSQPLSALMCLHLKILNTLTALMRLHLKIANQELGSPAVCTKTSEKIHITQKSPCLLACVCKKIVYCHQGQ